MTVSKGGGCNTQLSTSQNQNIFMSIYFGVSLVLENTIGWDIPKHFMIALVEN
jgi:hypothetical protein